MIVTKRMMVEKLMGYLNHQIDLNDLVGWAETSIMDADFEETDYIVIREILAKIGLADVKMFGLTWDDCVDFLQQLGYRPSVEITKLV